MDVSDIISEVSKVADLAKTLLPVVQEIVPSQYVSAAVDIANLVDGATSIVSSVTERISNAEIAATTDDKATLDKLLADLETVNAGLSKIIDAS